MSPVSTYLYYVNWVALERLNQECRPLRVMEVGVAARLCGSSPLTAATRRVVHDSTEDSGLIGRRQLPVHPGPSSSFPAFRTTFSLRNALRACPDVDSSL